MDDNKVTKIKSDGVSTNKSNNDILKTVMHDLWVELIKPSLKNLLSNVIKSGSDYLIFRKDVNQINYDNRFNTNNGYTSYGKCSSSYNDQRNSSFAASNNKINSVSWKKASVSDYSNVSFNNPTDARMLIDTLMEKINSTGMVSLAEMYDIVDIPFDFVANDYGWTSLKSASIYLRDGKWYIRFPKPICLK